MTELCIDQKYIEERENIQKEDNPVVHIIVSGRLIYRKGIQVLLEAVTRMNVSASRKDVLDNRKGPAKASPLGYSCSKQLRM